MKLKIQLLSLLILGMTGVSAVADETVEQFMREKGLDQSQTQVIELDRVCFPSSRTVAQRCHDHLSTLHLLSNESLFIVGSCKRVRTCGLRGQGRLLVTSAVIITKAP